MRIVIISLFYECDEYDECDNGGGSQKSKPLLLNTSKSLFAPVCVISARSGRFYKVGLAEIRYDAVSAGTHHLQHHSS